MSIVNSSANTGNNLVLPNSVLFLCAMNAVRSPMAEVLAKKKIGSRLYIQSAGVRKGELDPFVISLMREKGFDLSRHVPRTLEELEDNFFDLIITLTPEAHHKAMEMTRYYAMQVEYWPMPDPTVVQGSRARILTAYDELYLLLNQKIERRFS